MTAIIEPKTDIKFLSDNAPPGRLQRSGPGEPDRCRTDPPWSRAIPSLCLFVLPAACGIKPGGVDPPPGVDKNAFPLVYSDPATDPKPVGAPAP